MMCLCVYYSRCHPNEGERFSELQRVHNSCAVTSYAHLEMVNDVTLGGRLINYSG